LGVQGCQKDSEPDSATTITLKFSSSSMPTEPPNILANHLLDLVEEKTVGRVKIERYMGGSLGGPLEQLELVASGAVDIIPLHTDQFPQQLPLHQILNSDQFVTSEEAFANIIAITREIPETKAIFDAEQRDNNIKILYWHCMGYTGITTGFPARSLEDVKGKKVNVISGFQRALFGELGFIPVNVQIPELYESLSRGVIDAIFMATSAVVPLKWHEVGESYLTLGDSVVFSQAITLNLDAWNSLPEDIQKVFLDASLETARWSIEENARVVKDTYGAFEQYGVDLVILPPEETRAYCETLSEYSMAEWLSNASERGVSDKAGVIRKYWDEMKWGGAG
jgi:TRAP-type C4-dicarboxylate transport system substrate-binding protein